MSGSAELEYVRWKLVTRVQRERLLKPLFRPESGIVRWEVADANGATSQPNSHKLDRTRRKPSLDDGSGSHPDGFEI